MKKDHGFMVNNTTTASVNDHSKSTAMDYSNMLQSNEDIDLFPESEIILEPASSGKRLLNFVIDIVGYYAFSFLLGILFLLLVRDRYIEFVQGLGQGGLLLYGTLIYFTYITLFEGLGKGRSLGKICTGTRAVREDGTPIGLGKALLRTLVRYIPFEMISLLFGGRFWHDEWTGTQVIDLKRSTLPQR
jgi:uncharacterized RDD family membrane protein YckC